MGHAFFASTRGNQRRRGVSAALLKAKSREGNRRNEMTWRIKKRVLDIIFMAPPARASRSIALGFASAWRNLSCKCDTCVHIKPCCIAPLTNKAKYVSYLHRRRASRRRVSASSCYETALSIGRPKPPKCVIGESRAFDIRIVFAEISSARPRSVCRRGRR